ncbi:glycosyl transferase, family 2 [Olavius sp. associated proteobacterium Delta 1]|nr:glycosyl transferase, family 2 [Olavius sp. associated proteobacterium Delta 1]
MIFDNGSTDETKQSVMHANMQFAFTYLNHGSNIGGDKNVLYAYTQTSGEYTWVIGDDELLPDGALQEIIRLIKKYSPGMILNKPTLYPALMNIAELYNSYSEFAAECLNYNPHYLIAHSLISMNVIRRDCFDNRFAQQNLDTRYTHFFGMTNGLLSKNESIAFARSITLIVRLNRAPIQFEKENGPYHVMLGQNQYLTWLLNKLKMNNSIPSYIISNCEKKLEKVWHSFSAQENKFSELQLIQSIMIDNQRRLAKIKNDQSYRETQNSERQLVLSVCDRFDQKVQSLRNTQIPKLATAAINQKEDRFNHQPRPEIPISLLVPVYNEAERIPFVLESGTRWADEIIIINKSSTDRTKEICLQFGPKVKVIDVPFSHQGNGNIADFATIPTNDWIYFGTASEIPTRNLINRIKQILEDSEGNLDLVYVPRKYYSFGLHDPRSPWYVSYFPFLINRQKAIISDTIHHHFKPNDPNNTVKIKFSDDCCVYHFTHRTAKGYLNAMTDYFEAEAEGCRDPAAKIQQCMAYIAQYEDNLRNGGNDLIGHYFAWLIYWLGTALFLWEKWRGINVPRYYHQLGNKILQQEWLVDHDTKTLPEIIAAPEVDHTLGKPLVSAIVSNYNSKHLLRGCLEDLESQTINDQVEIIVVDSGLEEGEEVIIEDFQKRYKNIKYIKTSQREWIYSAWNRGIRAASGKYITAVNAGDRLLGYAYERMANVLQNNSKIALVYPDAWITNTANQSFEEFTPTGSYCRKDFNPLTLIDDCYIGSQPMWRKSLHDKYGYFDEKFQTAGDWDFWLRIAPTETFYHLKEFLGLCLASPAEIVHPQQAIFEEETRRIYQQYSSGKLNQEHRVPCALN